MKTHVDLMIDSGAYSAWTKQLKFSVHKYIRFLERHRDCVEVAINLDKIPGRLGGGLPTAAEVEDSASIGWANFEEIRKAGFEAMPVYHYGERRYWLDKMINEGSGYVGISPGTKRAPEVKTRWLDSVFEYLCGQRGYPTVKTHAFGITSLPILFRYPWYSADSVTWMLVSSYGAILVPTKKNGQHCYQSPPLIVKVSRRKRSGLDSLRPGWENHFDSLGPSVQKYIRDYLEEEGFDLEQMFGHYRYRTRQCVRFFKRVEQYWQPRPFVKRSVGLWDKQDGGFTGAEAKYPKLRLYFSTCVGGNEHNDQLQDEKIRNRLITYFYFIKRDPINLHNYVKTGRIPKSKKSQESAA